MQRIFDFIFNISPKKLAIYLVLGPLLLFLVHTVITIVFRNISETSAPHETIVNIFLGALFILLTTIILLWLFWLRSTVYSVDNVQLGIARKWFRIAFAMICVFILFNVVASIIENLSATHVWLDDYMYMIYSSRELINFAGIMIAYPVVCHYAARATYVKVNVQPATFISALAFTIMLLFGTVMAIPFLHKYFSTKTSKNSEIIIIYAIAFGLVIILFIIGFMAAIAGLV